VLAWGWNGEGQTTVPIAAQSGVTAIAAGGNYGNHTVALKNDGSVLAWGDNRSGQTTVPVAAQGGVVSIAAGGDHTVALKNDGTVVAWGSNGEGQTTVPADLSGVTAIAAGGAHTVALIGTALVMPSLTSRHSGNELVLTWSTNAAGFTLQSAPSLTLPISWSNITDGPALLGAQWTVTNTFSGNAQFYRLRKP